MIRAMPHLHSGDPSATMTPGLPGSRPPGGPSRRRWLWLLVPVLALGGYGGLSAYRANKKAARIAAERAQWARAAQKAAKHDAQDVPRLDPQLSQLLTLVRRLQATLATPDSDPSTSAASDLATATAALGYAAIPALKLGGSGTPGQPIAVQDAQLSPDGESLLTGDADGRLQLWSTRTGQALHTLQLPAGGGALLLSRFSPDGKRALSVSADGTVRVWDLQTYTQVSLAQLDLPPAAVRDAELSPDGKLLLVASGTGAAFLLQASSGALLRTLAGHTDEVTVARFVEGGSRVLTASTDGQLRLFETATGTLLLAKKAHDSGVRTAQLGPQQKLLVTTGSEGATLWQLPTLQRQAQLVGHTAELMSARFSPDGQRVVTTSTDRTARLWEVRDGRLLAAPLLHHSAVSDACFSPDGTLLLTASVEGTARLWDTATLRPLLTLRGHTARLTTSLFSPDGALIVTASLDGHVRTWTARPLQGAPPPLRHPDRLTDARLSPDGQRVLTIGQDDTARLWDAHTGQLRQLLLGHHHALTAAAFTGDGRHVVSASEDGTARLWDALSGRPLQVFPGHTQRIVSLSVSERSAEAPERGTNEPAASLGPQLVSVSDDGTARLWSLRTGLPRAALQSPTGKVTLATFSPDGRQLLTADESGQVRLWDSATLTELWALPQHSHRIRQLTFSPRPATWGPNSPSAASPGQKEPSNRPGSTPEQYLTTSSDDGSVRVWEPKTGQLLATLRGHSGGAPTVRFAPSGTLLATGASDGQVRLWSPRREEPLKTLQDEGGAISVLRFSPDGSRLLSGGSEDSAVLWEVATGQVVQRLAGSGPLLAGDFSRDGHFVLLGWSDGEVRLQPQSAAPFVTAACQLLRQHPAPFLAVASKCAPYLAAADLLERPLLPQQLSPPMLAQAAAPEPSAADGGAPVAQTTPPQAAGGSAWRQDLARSARAISAGCFAWSTLHSAAVCRVGWRNSSGRQDIQERFSVRFLPPLAADIPIQPELGGVVDPRVPRLLSGTGLTALEQELQQHLFQTDLTGTRAPGPQPLVVPLGQTLMLSQPAVRVGFTLDPARPAASSKEPRSFTLWVRCGGGAKAGKLALYHHPVPPGAAPQRIGQAVAVVQLMPGSRHLVLSLERRFEQAGTLHQQEDAAVVDLKTCTASTSFGEATP